MVLVAVTLSLLWPSFLSLFGNVVSAGNTKTKGPTVASCCGHVSLVGMVVVELSSCLRIKPDLLYCQGA